MDTGYWNRVTNSRISRRRLLATTAAAGAGVAALSLIGCGGDSAAPASREGKGLLAPIADTTNDAKPGGVLRGFRTGDVSTFDPVTADNIQLSNTTQSKLTMGVPVALAPYDGRRQGDLAESWEISGDGLQWTFKLRNNAVFPELPGGKKRNVDAQDVLFSYGRYEQFGGEYRAVLSNAAGAAGPVLSATAPDNRTVVLKLAFPYAGLLGGLDYFFIYPREAEKEYDPRTTMLGSGPWVIEQYQGSAFLNYKRNPEWHFKGRPFIEKFEQPILSDYAARMAQFRAGRIHYGVLRQEDIIATKKELPQLNLYTLGYTTQGVGDLYHLVFGLRPGSPFLDERMRQAASMAIDRDTWIDVFYNVSKFRAEGLDVDQRHYSHFGLRPEQWVITPDNKDFGPNAKYLSFDLTEAKRLQSAAGHGSGFKTIFQRTSSTPGTHVQAWINMIKDNLGWDMEDRPAQGVTGATYSDLLNTRGDFDGFSVSGLHQRPDPGVYLYHKYATNASSGRLKSNVDADMDRMFDQQLREQDTRKRVEIMHNLQRHLAQKQWFVVMPGGAERYDLAWPALKNYAVHEGTNIDVQNSELAALNYWIDQTAT
jgi:ABC-type transport system substrate-binding protein